MKKFDVIISNPPFNRNLHLDFLSRYINISALTVSIQPCTWLMDPIGKYKKHSDYNKYHDIIKHIKDIEVFTTYNMTKLFTNNDLVAINNNIGIYTLDEEGGWKNIYSNSLIEKVMEKTTFFPYKLYKSDKKKYFCLILLIRNGQAYRNNYNKSTDIIRDENIYGRYYINGISLNGRTVEENKRMNKRSTNGNTENWPVIDFDTETEVINFYNYTKTKFFRYIFKHITLRPTISLKYLPYIGDYTREWTDSDLYEYFELTPDEIKNIEDEF